jgi:mono/diheme cytochrome c family protein
MFWTAVVALIITYIVLRFGIAHVSAWITGAQNPQPVPQALLAMYILLALAALAVQVATSDQSLRDFVDPLAELIRGRPSPTPGGDRLFQVGRVAILLAVPLVAGWMTFQRASPSLGSPVAGRIQHPTLPGEYETLSNLFRALPPDEQAAVVREGVVLYQINCRPCHGTAADGDGPMARGFRLRPIDFTDPGTIATLVENYPVWRIKKGGIGLPASSTPWDSAMPAWEGELTDEEIWKIIMAEYSIAGKEPRRPEQAE